MRRVRPPYAGAAIVADHRDERGEKGADHRRSIGKHQPVAHRNEPEARRGDADHPGFDDRARAHGRSNVEFIRAGGERDVGPRDHEDEQRHPAVGAVDIACGIHQLRKQEEKRRSRRRDDKGDEHAVPHDDALVGALRAQLLGEAALEPQSRELRDEFDDEHGKGEAPDRLGPVPAARHIEKGQARDEAEDEAEEIGAPALGECRRVRVARRDVGRLGRGCAIGLAQAWRPFCFALRRSLARREGAGNCVRQFIALRVAADG